jgi:hypothetical protein
MALIVAGVSAEFFDREYSGSRVGFEHASSILIRGQNRQLSRLFPPLAHLQNSAVSGFVRSLNLIHQISC